MINQETPERVCQFCGQWHYCQFTYKPRELEDGSWVHRLLLLCSFCDNGVKRIPNDILLPERRLR